MSCAAGFQHQHQHQLNAEQARKGSSFELLVFDEPPEVHTCPKKECRISGKDQLVAFETRVLENLNLEGLSIH